MSLYYLLIAAVIQGITEFLPISSSGHLILLPALSGAQDQGLAIDVAVHVGTLLAVILYFWRDVRSALVGLGRLVRGKVDTPGAMLAFLLMISTVPVMIVGLAIKLAGLDEAMRSVAVIGWAMLGFGIVLYWADRTGATTKAKDDWTLKDAVAMGLAQVIALIPGTSRSGITITVGQANWALARDGGIAAAFAFVAALLSLKLMMKLLKSVDFTPYVIYRIIFGLFLLWWAYS